MRRKNAIRVLIATDNTIFRECLIPCLSRESDLQILPAASDPSELLARVQKLRPDLILLDADSLGPFTDRLLVRLRRVQRSARVLVLAARGDDKTVARALRHGAAGLVAKTQNLENLLAAMRSVSAGEIWAGRSAMAKALSGLSETHMAQSSTPLTSRESQLASLLKEGYTNKELAKLLKIREQTVKAHLHSLFRKINVRTRVEAALKFAEDGTRYGSPPLPTSQDRGYPSSSE